MTYPPNRETLPRIWALRDAAASVLAVVVAASVLGLGCGCPTHPQIKADRKVTGQLTYQRPGEVPMTGDLAPLSGFDVTRQGSGASADSTFAFTFEPDGASRGTSSFSARLVVPLVPTTDSEIELGDEVASLTGHTGAVPAVYHALTGHLSVRWTDSTCQTDCPLQTQGTVTVSATGPDEEVFEVTSGAFVAADTFRDVEICQD